ncbi:MAG: SOS response-associated peptidase [Myxococcales bacterium]|nr:SOS response-associated peptidase [Myxococcales bacterium]
MCGRYTLKTPASDLQAELELDEAPAKLRQRYNIAPTQDAAIVPNGEHRRLEAARWGLLPHWAKDARIGNKMINARAETVAEKPAYREALKRRRCLVPADGFFEWKQGPLGKSPLHVRRRDGRPFAFAGLFESWRGPEGEVRSFTIITSSANPLVSTFHQRMPVILAREDFDLWLSPEPVEPARLLPLLRPYPHDDLEVYEVSRLVNSPSNDVPECIAPA